jgi:hypothetical protein
MSQIEKRKKSSTFTCPNASCGKVFTQPLRALNLQQDPEKPYDACPYCLTEIDLYEKPTVPFDETKTFDEPDAFAEPEEAEAEVEAPKRLEEKLETPEKSSGCLHYVGYLSERSSKEQIPDECMMCKDIVTCMLKKMKG